MESTAVLDREKQQTAEDSWGLESQKQGSSTEDGGGGGAAGRSPHVASRWRWECGDLVE